MQLEGPGVATKVLFLFESTETRLGAFGRL